jgi:metal-responsive CopG/Arc/MetJ family transcriptional regulator
MRNETKFGQSQVQRPATKIEPRHTFSIYLPTSLYQKLLDKAGKGHVSTFIKKMLEENLAYEQKKADEELERQLIAGYKANAENEKLQAELGA